MKRIIFSLLSVVFLLAAVSSIPARPARAISRHLESSVSRSLPAGNFALSSPQTTVRQQIVDAVKARLKKIDSSADPLANGYQYQTDIGKNDVERWQTNYNQDELKAAEGKARVAVFDLVRTREKTEYEEAGVIAILPVQVRVFHYRDSVGPEELTRMLADVQQAVVTDPDTGEREVRLNGLAIDIKPGDDGFIIPNDVFTLEGGAVGFSIEHMIDPYGQ